MSAKQRQAARRRAAAMAWAMAGAGAAALGLLAACDGGARGSAKRREQVERAQASRDATASTSVSGAAIEGLREIDAAGLRAALGAGGRKATLLNVWASWCGSCKRELPMLVELAEALRSEGVELMLVSVDAPEARKDAVALLQTLSPTPESFVVRGSLGPFKRAVNPAWKGALPATALYDAAGELLWFWPGPVLEHEITSIVSAYLAGEPLEGPILVEP